MLLHLSSQYSISIHTFRVEGDQKAYTYEEPVYEFQSTPSVWKVTENVLFFDRWQKFQSTPSVWKVTANKSIVFSVIHISIHTFRVEGDQPKVLMFRQLFQFQSTPSVWKVTGEKQSPNFDRYISIHTFRVEGDGQKLDWSDKMGGISIHTFRVEGDALHRLSSYGCNISIHTFRVEGDNGLIQAVTRTTYFNPHLPCGR